MNGIYIYFFYSWNDESCVGNIFTLLHMEWYMMIDYFSLFLHMEWCMSICLSLYYSLSHSLFLLLSLFLSLSSSLFLSIYLLQKKAILREFLKTVTLDGLSLCPLGQGIGKASGAKQSIKWVKAAEIFSIPTQGREPFRTGSFSCGRTWTILLWRIWKGS